MSHKRKNNKRNMNLKVQHNGNYFSSNGNNSHSKSPFWYLGEITDKKPFYIPDYQRGYRWEEDNVNAFLEDIWNFHNKKLPKEIYCIQPLVIQEKDDRIDVVDGQQRLTTSYLIMGFLRKQLNISEGMFTIDYQTRTGSTSFLSNLIKEELKDDQKPESNIDYYHMNCVYQTIRRWFILKEYVDWCFAELEINADSSALPDNAHDISSFDWLDGVNCDLEKKEKVKKLLNDWINTRQIDCKIIVNVSDAQKKLMRAFYNTFTQKVCFIPHDIKGEKATDVFSRLNEGKIPLTDAELIKALFLKDDNYIQKGNNGLSELQQRIAIEWDSIEKTLQNDEFWLFIHNQNYSNPTRIDYIFDLTCKFERLSYKSTKIKNTDFKKEHETLSYFQRAFNLAIQDTQDNDEWIKAYWKSITDVFDIFVEWFNDYKLFHYIGYLISISGNNEAGTINDLLDNLFKPGMTKSVFENYLIEKIITNFSKDRYICYKKDGEYITWQKFVFDNGDNGDATSDNYGKGYCVDLLLIHNIETIITQNDKLIEDKKKDFGLPEFSRFPFHLFKKDDWQVEHISSNSGDKVDSYDSAITYLWYIGETLSLSQAQEQELDGLLRIGKKEFSKEYDNISKFIEKISVKSSVNKNIIYNYTLLDQATNGSYGNWMFPVKRMHIINKEQGKKPVINVDGGEPEITYESEVAFVPICTRKIFTLAYSNQTTDITQWTQNDADAYMENINELLGKKFLQPAVMRRVIDYVYGSVKANKSKELAYQNCTLVFDNYGAPIYPITGEADDYIAPLTDYLTDVNDERSAAQTFYNEYIKKAEDYKEKNNG